jgi:hypothetical protein
MLPRYPPETARSLRDDLVRTISYSRKRLIAQAEDLARRLELDPAIIAEFMFTKYAHWRYETEVRALVTLSEKDPATGLYFSPFSQAFV